MLIITIGLLLAVLSNFIMAGAYLGFLRPEVHIAALVGLFLAALPVTAILSKVLANAAKESLAATVFILLFLAANLLLCFTPPIARDELNHHLAFPKLMLQQGAFVHHPHAAYSFYPMLLQMFFIPVLWLGEDHMAKVIHYFFGVMTGLLIYFYAQKRAGAKPALFAFLIFLSVPVVQKLMHTAYVDLALMFYSTAALLLLLHWGDDQRSRYLFLAGAASGFALCSKPNGLIVAALLFVALIILAKKRCASLSGVSKAALQFAFMNILCIAPWYLKNYAAAGNPFYPLFTSYFGSTIELGAYERPQTKFTEFQQRELIYGESPLEIMLVPLRVFITGQDANPRLFDGSLSALLLLFIPWALLSKVNRDKRYILFFTLGYFIIAFFSSATRARYLAPAAPGLAILAAFGIEELRKRARAVQITLGTLGMAAMAHHLYYAANNLSKLDPIGLISGEVSRENYLARQLPYYSLLSSIPKSLASSERVYLAFAGKQIYYIEQNFHIDELEYPDLLIEVIRTTKNPAEIHEQLKKHGISSILMRASLLSRYFNDNLSEDERVRWNGFLKGFTLLLGQSKDYALYQLNEREGG
ncbi:MAG: glycosyltransferase family 39 protein [Deltaproteobacteria bacterium]|nr:glycosyltransferase family 39 protein [Deltaproteobacteria bacterium]